MSSDVTVGRVGIIWRKFKRSKASLVGGGIVMFVALVAIFSHVLYPSSPQKIKQEEMLLPPSIEHPLGTDSMGRDVLAWITWGAQTSLMVGLGAVLIETVIALVLGGLAGYYGGIIDEVLMRITDIILVLPTIILLIVAISFFKVRSLFLTMTVIAFLSWPWTARVVRSQFLTVKESLYVEAAKSLGAKDRRVIIQHILPNILSPIIVLATFDLAWFILYEATLTFLGFGDPLTISWGTLINWGRVHLRGAWWITTFPGLAIFLTVLGFNLLGDGLRDAFDIRERA